MIFSIIILIYAALCLLMAVGFLKHHQIKTDNLSEDVHFSIVLAARNEQKTIENCLNSIVTQNYPKQNIEVILVNDCSSDETAQLAKKFLNEQNIDHVIINNTQHLGKKKSLIKAIEQAKYDLIISRDADTFTASTNWLNAIASFYVQTKKEFIICPVFVSHNGGLLSAIQEIETSVLGVFTIASAYFNFPFLCSGANLVFSKQLFKRTNSYSAHLNIASGDDVFFLNEVKIAEPHQIAYLKNTDAVVYTFPEKTISELLNQKIRWSGKVFNLKSGINLISALTIAVCNGTVVFLLFKLIFSGFITKMALFFVILKLLIDILLVFLASHFVKIRSNLVLIGLTAILYPIYASAVALLSLLLKPKWKTS